MTNSNLPAARYFVAWQGKEHVVSITQVGELLSAEIDGVHYPVDLTQTEDGALLNAIIGTQSVTYASRFEDGEAVLGFHDQEVRLRVENEREHLTRQMTGASSGSQGPAEVKSVMPGVVKELRVSVGDVVKADTPLLILEAMKMENELRAKADGVVQSIAVKAGQAVEKGALLLVMGPSPDAQ